MTEDQPPAPRLNRIWLLIGAIAVVAVTVGVMAVITWIAFDGAEDTERRLDTAAAADGLRAVAERTEFRDGAAPLPACPAGPATEVLGNLAEALGGGPFSELVNTGEAVSFAVLPDPDAPPSQIVVECGTSGTGPGELWLVSSADPTSARDTLNVDTADGWTGLGTSRGGTYEGRCGSADAECVVLWSDTELLAAIGGAGPAFDGVDRERVQAVLAAFLPSLVAALADA